MSNITISQPEFENRGFLDFTRSERRSHRRGQRRVRGGLLFPVSATRESKRVLTCGTFVFPATHEHEGASGSFGGTGQIEPSVNWRVKRCISSIGV